MGNGALASGLMPPRPSSTLPSRRFWNVRLKAALLISVAILAATAGLSWRFLDRRSGLFALYRSGSG